MVKLLPPLGGPLAVKDKRPEPPVLDFTPRTRAWAVLHFIDENREAWSQESWNMCFAAHVVRQHGKEPRFMSAMETRVLAMELLEIGSLRAARLFGASVTLSKLRRRVRRYFGEDPFAP